MSIPEKPYTRREMYLDAIAQGNTSSMPETPYTREEMYLDAIARGGGGGNAESNVFLAHFVYDESLMAYETSESWESIVAAGDAGKAIIVYFDDIPYLASYSPAGEDDGETYPAGISFEKTSYMVAREGNEITGITIKVNTYWYSESGLELSERNYIVAPASGS